MNKPIRENPKIKLTDPQQRVKSLAQLFRLLVRVVKENAAGGEEAVDRQKLALTASKELRSILADIAAEAGGRKPIPERTGASGMEELSDAELERLIELIKAG